MARTFGIPVLFAVAAILRVHSAIFGTFRSDKNILLCTAGFAGLGVIGSGMLLSIKRKQRRRICAAVGLALSSLVTCYGLKKMIPLKTALPLQPLKH